jgi:hypothetical protein
VMPSHAKTRPSLYNTEPPKRKRHDDHKPNCLDDGIYRNESDAEDRRRET